MKRPSIAAVIAPGGAYTGLVWPLSLAQLVSWGSIYYSFTLFVAPMEAELGLERTELTGALTLGLLVSGACSLPVGALIDKGYARALMSAASVLAGVLLLAWSEVRTGTQFFVIWAGLGAVLAATLYEPAFAVLVRSLGSLGKRGIASMTLVGGLASTAFIPLTHVLIEDLGWRGALQVLALFNFAVCAPIHVIVLRRARPVRATGDRGATAPAVKRVMGRPALWWLALAFTASIFSVSALTFHVVPMLSERGYALGAIVSAFALFGPSQVATRILVTVIAPGVNLLVTGCLAFGLPILALIVVLLGPEGFGTIALFAICLGSGNGIVTIVRAVAVAELFGEAGFGTINGIIAVPVNVARALAPATAAALWAATGGYGPVLWVLSAVSLVSLLAYVLGVLVGRRAGLGMP
jgi:MFS family permease